MSRIAGHEFVSAIGGDICNCGMKWSRLLSTTQECINQEGYAHIGRLSAHEFSEIETERERVFSTLKM